MALDICESCNSVEGGWRLGTIGEVMEQYGINLEPGTEVGDEWDNYVCEQCGGVGCRRGVPEHDDGDER